MHVWIVVHAARWKCRTQKIAKNSPSVHHRTNLLGNIFATKACIDNRKKRFQRQYLLHMCPEHGELRPTNGWDPSGSLRHPYNFQRASRLGSVTARHIVAGVSQTAALNRGRHLCSAGRPSHWALAHIVVDLYIVRELSPSEVGSRCWFYWKICLFGKNDPLREDSFVMKEFIVTQIHVLCANFVKFGRREVREIVCCLPHKKI